MEEFAASVFRVKLNLEGEFYITRTVYSYVQYVVGQLSLQTCHRVLAVAALDKSLSMV